MEQMNALSPLFPNALLSFRLLAAGALCAVSAGCIADPVSDTRVDAASPVAADVQRLSRANADFPSFNEIPAVSPDARPLRAYGEAAQDLKLAAAQLERETADNTWTLRNSEEFAERLRRNVPDIAPPSPGEAEAFARELRERATPPPPRR
jgi:hypothetical protein